MAAENILEARRISKSYPGVQALAEVDFDLKVGEVHALVGQNGAGKSTLVEIIAGSLRPDSGKIVYQGEAYSQLDPSKSIDLGIQTVHQENQLVNELSVAENIYLYNLPRSTFGIVNYPECRANADKLLQSLGIDIDSSRKVSRLTFIEKKLVSIAKARSRQEKVLIFDEPTASLDEHGKNLLFDIIQKNVANGLSVLYISHNLGEIFEICDRVTVLKDGVNVGTQDVHDVTMSEVVRQMIGRSADVLYSRDQTFAKKDAPGLEVLDYSRKGVLNSVSFTVHKGEIFGLGGLVGAGRTELARMMFGLDPKDTGELVLEGKNVTPDSPSDAIRKGIGYLTEDRKEDGLTLGQAVSANISLVSVAKSAKRALNLSREQTDTDSMSKMLDIKTPSVAQLVINLSGGNQQKVVLGKWLYAESEVLIFDEPTVGVDVGAKSEIYRMMEDLAKDGKIIIMISSDNPELAAVSDRVGVMRGKELAAILEGEQITEENILSYAMGVDQQGR